MGLQHRRTGGGERYWLPERESCIYFLQNDAGAREWPCTGVAGDAACAALEAAFDRSAAFRPGAAEGAGDADGADGAGDDAAVPVVEDAAAAATTEPCTYFFSRLHSLPFTSRSSVWPVAFSSMPPRLDYDR